MYGGAGKFLVEKEYLDLFIPGVEETVRKLIRECAR